MKTTFLVIGCIPLLCILDVTCLRNRKWKNKTPQPEEALQQNEHKVAKKRYLADSEEIKKAEPYQQIHVKMYDNDFEAYKEWSELERKTLHELAEYCKMYLICIGTEVVPVKFHPKLEVKNLKYHIIDDKVRVKHNTISYHNYHKTKPVRMLKCQLSTNRLVYRFVKAKDRYSAFFVKPTNSSKNLFTIVGACHTSTLNEIISTKLYIMDVPPKKRKYYRTDSLILEKAALTAEQHATMHMDNMCL